MRFALDTRYNPPKRVKAERTLDSAPKGTFICPNPFCVTKEVYIKGNERSSSRSEEMKKRAEEERTIHVAPHFAHYTAENLGVFYREEAVASDHAIKALQRFLNIPDTDVEVWFKGETKETTLAADFVKTIDGTTYAFYLIHGDVSAEDYERIDKCSTKYLVFPVFILHKVEGADVTDNGESIRGNYGKISQTKKWEDRRISNLKADLSSKLERRLARRQGFVIYYELVPNQTPNTNANSESNTQSDSLRFDVKLTAVKYKRSESRKQTYLVTEMYDLVLPEHLYYICSKIAKRKTKYELLRMSDKFNEDDHYAYDEMAEEWVLHTKGYKCAGSGKLVYFPPNVEVPKDYMTPSEMEEYWKEHPPTSIEKSKYYKLDEKRWND